MAVTPLAPATFAPAPIAAVPIVADPSVTVAPPAASTNSSGTDSATSEQSNSQKLPLDKALDEINEQMKAWSTQLQFEVDPDVHQVVVRWSTPNRGTSYAPSPAKPCSRSPK